MKGDATAMLREPVAELTGAFNYVGQGSERAVYFKNQPEANVNFETHVMPVADIRRFATPPALEREGFEIGHVPLTVDEAEGADAIQARYEPLLRRFLAERTGAPKIIIKQPLLRWSDRQPNAGQPNMTPSHHVHCDFDADAFHAMAREMLGDDPERERWLAGRYAVIQTWRALSPPPLDTPLAVIDRRTIDPADLVKADFVFGLPGEERRFQNFAYRYNPAHRWAYISNMTSNDVLLFMGFDSADDAMTGNPHTSFDYWRHDPSALPRRSCEVRAFIFWG